MTVVIFVAFIFNVQHLYLTCSCPPKDEVGGSSYGAGGVVGSGVVEVVVVVAVVVVRWQLALTTLAFNAKYREIKRRMQYTKNVHREAAMLVTSLFISSSDFQYLLT